LPYNEAGGRNIVDWRNIETRQMKRGRTYGQPKKRNKGNLHVELVEDEDANEGFIRALVQSGRGRRAALQTDREQHHTRSEQERETEQSQIYQAAGQEAVGGDQTVGVGNFSDNESQGQEAGQARQARMRTSEDNTEKEGERERGGANLMSEYTYSRPGGRSSVCSKIELKMRSRQVKSKGGWG
jgi:hypothetical protein